MVTRVLDDINVKNIIYKNIILIIWTSDITTINYMAVISIKNEYDLNTLSTNVYLYLLTSIHVSSGAMDHTLFFKEKGLHILSRKTYVDESITRSSLSCSAPHAVELRATCASDFCSRPFFRSCKASAGHAGTCCPWTSYNYHVAYRGPEVVGCF